MAGTVVSESPLFRTFAQLRLNNAAFHIAGEAINFPGRLQGRRTPGRNAAATLSQS